MNWLEKYGRRLALRGWTILPLQPASKVPAVRDWPAFLPDPSQVDKWVAKGFGRYSIGIVTRNTPAVDIDILDAAVSAEMVAITQELVGPTLLRVGLPPKALLLYRCDEPFKKQESATYEDDFGCEHHVEILGDGQQFAAMGIHPITTKPYTWSSPIEDVYANAMPVITVHQAREIIEAFDGIALRNGWKLIADAKKRSPLTDMELAYLRLRPKPEDVDVPQLLRTLINDADMRGNWIRVGMAMHHYYEASDEGLDLWDHWSQQTLGGEYSLVSVYTAWQSFKTNLTTQKEALITMYSMLKRANEIERKLALADYAKRVSNGAVVAAPEEVNGTTVPEVDPRSKLRGWLDRYVFVVHGNIVHDTQRPAHDADIPYQAFQNLTKNAFIPIVDDAGKTKSQSLMTAWSMHPGRVNAERSIYEPAEPRLIRRGSWNYINSFWLPEHPKD